LHEGTKEGIQKGAEGAKEGAEAVGEGAKDLVTDDDPDTDKDETITDRTKPAETQPGKMSDTEAQSGTSSTGAATSGRSSSDSSTTETESSASSSTEERELPRTAGELPLLAIAGVMALISAGTLRVLRRVPKD
jgi:hypothetical protein